MSAMKEWILYLLSVAVVIGAVVLLQVAGPYYEVGIASWYGPGFQGNRTSNGEVYDMYGISAAHKTLPFDTVVKVVDLDTGKSVVVRINDRGPFVEGRIIDLSKGAAEKLGIVDKGIARVGLRILHWPTTEGK
jgi:rare lipoprotein A